ncbi:IPT/TIG domain-containing protein [Streptomyces sp. NPDC058657]|uniref:IPT/TIG domain-containing protein n=1 Tax=unclassified Streptomyces TaxID=2593676 RepID=UPI0036495586
MGLYRQDGTRITKAGFPAELLTDPPVRVTEDVYVSEPYGRGDGKPEGSKLFLLYPAGTLVVRSAVDRMFTAATLASVSPVKGPAAGNTTVTIKGSGLDGVTAVTFGGKPGTGLNIISAGELTVKTPPGTAGAVVVALADDHSTVSKSNGFTYEAPSGT